MLLPSYCKPCEMFRKGMGQTFTIFFCYWDRDGSFTDDLQTHMSSSVHLALEELILLFGETNNIYGNTDNIEKQLLCRTIDVRS